eukprot:gene18076-19885_t
MQALVKLANIYIGDQKQRGASVNHSLLSGIARYLTKMLKIFGANEGVQDIGFPLGGADSPANREDLVMPYVEAVAKFRNDVRSVAKEEKCNRILELCDNLRDKQLIELGVQLEDIEGSDEPVVKLVDKEVLLREREQKIKELELKKKQKEEAKRKQAEEKVEQQALKEAKAKIPPSELFKSELDKYSKFDEQGIPTHDVSGKELSSSQVKKLKKLYAQQEKSYKKFLAENN